MHALSNPARLSNSKTADKRRNMGLMPPSLACGWAGKTESVKDGPGGKAMVVALPRTLQAPIVSNYAQSVYILVTAGKFWASPRI
jgi:hypothetical protein